MQRWLERVFDVPVAEQRKAALSLAHIFFAASACVVGRTVADTLFLARIGSDQLGWMYLVSALVVASAAMAYARLARGVSLRWLAAGTHVTLAVGAAALRWLLPAHHHDVYIIAPIYLLSEIQGALSAILFATVLNEVFGRPDARGVFGVAGIGSTLAGIVFGALVAFEADVVHAANLLWVMAALQLLALACALRLSTGGDAPVVESTPPSSRRTSCSDAAAEPESRAYEKWLVVLALVQFPAIMLVGYQWKLAVDDAYHLSEDAMAAYFGGYYAIMNTITLVLQAALAGRLLRRPDPHAALTIFPAALVVTAATALVSSGGRMLLWATTLSKGTEVLRRSFADPATQLLYQPLPQGFRRRVIAGVTGVVKPISEALGALAIVEITTLTTARNVFYVVATLAIVWILVAHRCRRLYLEAVPEETLHQPPMPRRREGGSVDAEPATSR
jgi:ATP/ADP translocase